MQLFLFLAFQIALIVIGPVDGTVCDECPSLAQYEGIVWREDSGPKYPATRAGVTEAHVDMWMKCSLAKNHPYAVDMARWCVLAAWRFSKVHGERLRKEFAETAREGWSGGEGVVVFAPSSRGMISILIAAGGLAFALLITWMFTRRKGKRRCNKK